MSKLKCECLNITLHIQGSGSRETEGKDFVSDSCSHVFFSGKLLEVELAVGGITKEVESLVRSSRVEDWDIYNCLNCGLDAYALHAIKGYDRVLVNQGLESDPEILKERNSSKQFSSPFKVILKEDTEKGSLDEGTPILLGQDAVTLAMASVQEMLKKYLKTEEAAMAERIRQYTEQQQEQFNTLQSNAFRDKTAIYRLINKAQEQCMETSLQEAILDTSEKLGPHMFKSPVHAAGLNEMLSKKPVNRVHITQVNAIRPVFEVGSPASQMNTHLRRSRTKVAQRNNKPSTADADPMFGMDGFMDDDCEPFFESEEEEMSSDNSFQSEESALPRHMYVAKKKPTPQYSSSVPISMPMAEKTSHSWEDDDDNEMAIPEPSKIRESMKALARSVHNNTQDMFGELPRPRLFTEPRPRLTEPHFGR